MHRMGKCAFAAALLLASGSLVMQPAQAQAKDDSDEGTSLFVVGQYGIGLRETFELDGDKFRIGDGAAAGVGVELRNAGDWRTRISIGYRYQNTEAGPSKHEFSVYPVDLVFVHDLGPAELGFGASYYIDPRYDSDDPGAQEIEFDDQFGLILQAGFAPTRFFGIGVRYNYVRYSRENTRFILPDGGTDNELDGSSVDAFVVISF